MKILIFAKPKSKNNKIEKVNERTYKVWIKEAPIDGKANDSIVRLLAQYFKINRSAVKLISGAAAKQKIFEILK